MGGGREKTTIAGDCYKDTLETDYKMAFYIYFSLRWGSFNTTLLIRYSKNAP